MSLGCREGGNPTAPSALYADSDADGMSSRVRAVRVAPSAPCRNPAPVFRCHCDEAGAFVQFKSDVDAHVAAPALAAKYSIERYDLTSWGNGMQIFVTSDVIYALKCEPVVSQIYLNRYPSPSGSAYCACPRS